MKRCRTCQRLKDEEEFYFTTNKTKRFKDCRPCVSKNIAEQKRGIYEWVDDHKASIGCEHCGERDKRCLQLHHRDSSNKKKSVATLIGKGYIFRTVRAEVQKCEVLCANCHSIHHYEERRAGDWGAGQHDFEAEEDECTPIVKQLELFLNHEEDLNI